MAKKPFSRLTRILSGGGYPEGEDPVASADRLPRLDKFAHFCLLVWQSFMRNRCLVRASALSFTTLLALIPMLAVAMSVTSIFLKSKGQEQIESFVVRFVSHIVPATAPATNSSPSVVSSVSSPEATNSFLSIAQTNAPVNDVRMEQAASYIHDFVQHTYSGTLGLTGVVVLLWTAIAMLARVEETFNDIWGVTRGRAWHWRILLYWGTITLGPMLLVVAFGIATGSHFRRTLAVVTHIPLLDPLISHLLPVVILCIALAFFYRLMPNTKVDFSAALVGGAVAGTAWHLFNVLNLHVATRAVNASKIYGGLALIALIMVGLYIVWAIVLFGAQVAYAYQNRAAYLQEKLVENINQRGREFIALRLMTSIGHQFQRGLPPPTVTDLSNELGLPSKLVQQVLRTLLAARLVVEVSRSEPGYAPARPLESINAHHILMAMRAALGQELTTREGPVRAEVYGEFARIQEAERQAASTVSMLDLVNRAQARLELAGDIPQGQENRMVEALTPPEEKT